MTVLTNKSQNYHNIFSFTEKSYNTVNIYTDELMTKLNFGEIFWVTNSNSCLKEGYS